MLTLHQAPAAASRLDLGRGVVVVMGALDSIQHASIVGSVQRDIAKLREGEDADLAWPLEPDELAGLEDEVVREAVARWMHLVLVAATGAEAIEGVLDPATGSAPAADLATFAWLFRDELFLQMFRLRAMSVETLYAQEGNVSGSGPSGSGATASTIAPDAAPSSSDAPAADAPMDASPPTSGASADSSRSAADAAPPSASAAPDAPRTDSHPAPISDASSGASDNPPASGDAAA